MAPAVSVIIPCYNAAPFVKPALLSVLQQTFKDLEIIVVDNGSTDETLTRIMELNVPLIRLEFCSNRSASAARNAGLATARGRFVQFLDADDLLAPDKIQIQIDRLSRAPAGTIAAGAWARFRDDPAQAVFRAEPVWKDCGPEDFLVKSWQRGGNMALFAWLTPRDVIERAGLWNEDLTVNDDGEFFCRVVLSSTGVAFCPEARGYYRMGSYPSLTRRRDREAFASAYRACALCCDHLLRVRSSKEARRACATLFQDFAFSAYPACKELASRAEQRAAELGGSPFQPGGGAAFGIVRQWFGWRTARLLQALRTGEIGPFGPAN